MSTRDLEISASKLEASSLQCSMLVVVKKAIGTARERSVSVPYSSWGTYPNLPTKRTNNTLEPAEEELHDDDATPDFSFLTSKIAVCLRPKRLYRSYRGNFVRIFGFKHS